MSALDGMVSAQDILDMKFVPPRTIGELVRQGYCTGQCLVAEGDAKTCWCQCRGVYHGALAAWTLQAEPEEEAKAKAEAKARVVDMEPRPVKATPCEHVWVEYFDGDLRCCDCDLPTSRILLERAEHDQASG